MILVDWEEDAKMIVKNFSRKEMERLNAIVAMDIMVRNIDVYKRQVLGLKHKQ